MDVQGYIDGLLEERRGYVLRGLDDRVEQVDIELARAGRLRPSEPEASEAQPEADRIAAHVEALRVEMDGYVRAGRPERAAAVQAEIDRWMGGAPVADAVQADEGAADDQGDDPEGEGPVADAAGKRKR